MYTSSATYHPAMQPSIVIANLILTLVKSAATSPNITLIVAHTILPNVVCMESAIWKSMSMPKTMTMKTRNPIAYGNKRLP